MNSNIQAASNTSNNEHSRRVREMFARIASTYDFLNHLLSANIDRIWRRRTRKLMADILARPDAVILDVACGTGDLTLELAKNSAAKVLGLDFCRPMLKIAQGKTTFNKKEVQLIEADAMKMPVADASFDAVTIAFGLRNLADHLAGLKELARILKPGGRLLVLECSKPSSALFRSLYYFYFEKLLPLIGGMVSGSGSAYRYLPDSVRKFPDQKTLAGMMKQVGLINVRYENLTGGIAAIHIAEKPTM
ncbi:MAG TPA: bifunctional demethylmenaquinone methyltransferase/2-methoxy-6-polyprenyl-1,4-benzoquinol methylase UbiE [Pyrinomonadaceae bacterium]|nr:bifunctional demethylmenaquinone methyltransferase/2-methoxy-6-polyprenyl-1,4-benzoquinol methylase UbiE [Pyrinomonadaceae bacterium]